MRKFLFPLFVAVLFTGSAFANVKSETAGCYVKFHAQAEGTQIIFGDFSIEGTGDVVCMNEMGETNSMAIHIKMDSSAGPFGINLGNYSFNGRGTTVAFVNNPEALLGDYHVLYGSATGGLGLGAFKAIQIDNDTVAMNVSLALTEGLGISLGYSSMTVSAL
jgi:hypothetical protein